MCMETRFHLVAQDKYVVSPAFCELKLPQNFARLPVFEDSKAVSIYHIAVIGAFSITDNPPADGWFLLLNANTMEFEGVRKKKYSSFNLDYDKEDDYSYWKMMVYRV